MAKRRRRQQWSKVIDELGVSVRLYERPAGRAVYMSYIEEGRKIQKSTKRSDRKEAEGVARAAVRGVVEDKMLGIGRTPTLGQLFKRYFETKAHNMSKPWNAAAEMRADLFRRCWGETIDVRDISQSQVDTFCSQRRSVTLTPLGNGGRKPRAVRDGTLDGDFRWLSSVFNWARKHKVNGRRLLSENPLHDCEWPKEVNVLRPVASHERYLKTQEHSDAVDPNGRLRAILALARWTGRRESAICGLMASDLLLSHDRVRAALAAAGLDERDADHMPAGAIRWGEETDKKGFRFITPLSRQARDELELYIQRNPRVGHVPLFPAPGVKQRRPRDGEVPLPRPEPKAVTRDCVATWLLRAEKAAGLPKLRGGTFHPYRRLWASERKNLPDVDVAAAGGWRDTRAMKFSYQHTDPASVLRVVELGA